ncbi:hypothetical protein BGP_3297 [Beggiatoa sp. PS]|nr:hypothetical protein BGP_3297 [Beggiatoa sp. PS]
MNLNLKKYIDRMSNKALPFYLFVNFHFQLPEIVIDSFEVNPEKLLKEPFKMIWNAFGFSHSLNYDDKGN